MEAPPAAAAAGGGGDSAVAPRRGRGRSPGFTAWNKGQAMPPAARKAMSEGMKKLWQDEEYRSSREVRAARLPAAPPGGSDSGLSNFSVVQLVG